MKRFYALALSGLMLTTSLTMSASAVSINPTVDGNVRSTYVESLALNKTDPTNESLESAIKAVKSKITIPKAYSQFDYYFYNSVSSDDFVWNLTWTNPKNGSSIHVTCDQKHRIIEYRIYDYSKKEDNVAKYLKKELKSKADEFLKKIAPEVALKASYKDASYDGIYSGNYIYNYERVENNVRFPENSVSIGVNSVTGEVTYASIQWLYDSKLPSSQVKISKEEASKLIKDHMTMNLVYRTNHYRIYTGSEGNQKKEAYLVYEPSKNYISVDAKTGEVYLTKVEWQEESNRSTMNDMAKEEQAADTAAKTANGSLTEEEIKKISELENLITKEEAIKKVTGNQYLHLDKNLEVYSATLNKNYYNNEKGSYVWNISLNDPREIDYEKELDYYRAYAYAQVDAKTGKLVSFYATVNNQYDEAKGKWNTVKITYDKEESRKILEKFLKAELKNYFNNSKLVNEVNGYIAYYKENTPVYGGYQYQYNRLHEGIEYPYNNIYGSVDGITGKIYSFGLNWDEDISFESPKGVMSPEKALEHYLSKDGYDLMYEISIVNTNKSNAKRSANYESSYTRDQVVRLVYHPNVVPGYISPFTGEQLDYRGEVFKKTEPYHYKDIDDKDENREILLLSDMNIGFEGEYFYPNQAITQGELSTILNSIGYGIDEKQMKNNNLVTKEELAKSFITELRLDKVADLQGIYKTDFVDESSIASKYLGAVALAKGLGIMDADNNGNFNPKNNVTRAEAVHYILNFLEVKQEGYDW